MNEPQTPSSPDDASYTVPPIAEDPTQHEWAQPEATEGSLEHVTSADDPDDGQWSRVDKSPPAATPPPIPVAVKIAGAAIIVLLLVGASWLGLTLGSSPTPSPTPTETHREWALEPPTVHEDWVRGEMSITEPAEGTDRVVVTSTYSTGLERVVLVLSRPETDISQYLADAAITSVEQVAGSRCGVSEDTDLPVCVQIRDATGILLAGTDGQSYRELDALLEEFYAVLSDQA